MTKETQGCWFLRLVFVVLIVVTRVPQSVAFEYLDPWGEPGLTLLSSTPDITEVLFSISEWDLTSISEGEKTAQSISIPGMYLPNQSEFPDIPYLGRLIALPTGSIASASITAARIDTLHNVDLAPAPANVFMNSEAEPLIRNSTAYSNNSYFPEDIVTVSAPTTIRGVNTSRLNISPFQYNPVTKDLLVYRDLQVEITAIGGTGQIGDDALRSREWDSILKSLLLNPDVLGPRTNQPFNPDDEGYEYIIITPDIPAFTDWADSLRCFRNRQGIRTGVFTLADIGGSSAEDIESFIDNAYHNTDPVRSWDVRPEAVLLLGDSDVIPSPTYVWNCDPYLPTLSYVSDNVYADVAGNYGSDFLPDLIVSRITARSNENNYHDLRNIIGKTLSYERTPPFDEPGHDYDRQNFYSKPLITGAWQSNKWYIITSEILAGFLENSLFQHPNRQYALVPGQTAPQQNWEQGTGGLRSRFGRHLRYNTPGEIPVNWSATNLALRDSLNAVMQRGAWLVNHCDHGGSTGWIHPDYDNGDIWLNNGDRLPFVISIDCSTGEFDYPWSPGICFAEALHRSPVRALGVIAASDSVIERATQVYALGIYNYFWSDFGSSEADPARIARLNPAVASTAAKLYLWNSSLQGESGDCREKNVVMAFHHHGEPYTNLFSAYPYPPYMPPLSVTHAPTAAAGIPYFTVAAEANSLIGISVNNELIGRAEGQWNAQDIPIVPQPAGATMVITVTKCNRLRYRAEVPVIWAPNVVYQNKSSETQIQYSGQALNGGSVNFNNDLYKDLMITRVADHGIAFPGDHYTGEGVPVFAGQASPWTPAPLNGTPGLIFADYDNDGWMDFFAPHPNGGRLYHNVSGTYVDVTAATGLTALVDSTEAASWGDYDKDGDVDLFVVKSHEFGEPFGGPGVLLRNDLSIDGYFRGAQGPWSLPTNSPLWADFDDDGDLDLFAVPSGPYPVSVPPPWPDYSPYYWVNDGDGTFTSGEGKVDNWQALLEGTYAAVADVNQDGYLDIVFMDQYESGYAENDGQGNFSIQGRNPHGSGVYDMEVVDYDLDGYPDIIAATGPNNQRTISVYVNQLGLNGKRVFVDKTSLAGTFGNAQLFGISASDFHNDGDMELYLSRLTSSPFFFEAHTAVGVPANHWIGVRLSSLYGANSRNGLGATVTVIADGRRRSQVIDGGSGRAGQHESSLVFGLGSSEGSVQVEVRWPNGRTQTRTVSTLNQYIDILDDTPVVIGSTVTFTRKYNLSTCRENWYFSWYTHYSSDNFQDKVIFDLEGIPERCWPPAGVISMNTPNVTHSQLAATGDTFRHQLTWTALECRGDCQVPYVVHSQLGTLATEGVPQRISTPACIQCQ